MSASAYATFDREPPRAGIRLADSDHAARLAAVRAEARAPALRDAWQTMPESWRIVLVMLACSQLGKPEQIARQPWGSFSEVDQLEMAIAARRGASVLGPFGAVA